MISNNSGKVLFIFSVASSVLLLVIERLVGMEWDYHPDSLTYINDSAIFFDFVKSDPLVALGKLYYIFVYLTGESIPILIFINIFFYAITNCIIFNYLKEYSKNYLSLMILIIYIFHPYRLHLSISVLKETLLFFFLVSSVIYSKYNFLLSLAFSLRSGFYAGAFFKLKYLFLLFILTLLLTKFLDTEVYFNQIINLNETNFSFRDYDNVPNFNEFGIYGSYLRSLIWPFIFLSGAFLLISPVGLFIPIAFGQVFSQLMCQLLFRRPLFSIGGYFVLGFFAFIINGFTTYFRYGYPLMLIIPLLMAKKEI